MKSGIKEDHEQYLMLGALIYSICLDTFKAIEKVTSVEVAEKMVLEATKSIAKMISANVRVNINEKH